MWVDSYLFRHVKWFFIDKNVIYWYYIVLKGGFCPREVGRKRFIRGVFGGKGRQIWFVIYVCFWPLSPFCDRKAESF
jgi:hypothetical protein